MPADLAFSAFVGDTFEVRRNGEGFAVTSGFATCEVRFEPWALVVSRTDRNPWPVGLFAGEGLASAIVSQVLSNRRRRRMRAADARAEHHATVSRLRAKVGAEIEAEAARLRAGVPEEVLRVQRAVHDASGGAASWATLTPELYEAPFVAEDIQRHPGAAIAAAFLDELVRRGARWDERWRLREQYAPADIDLLRRWADLFAPSRRSYGALRRTLANLPKLPDPRLLCFLKRVRLERPITDPLQLTAVCLRARMPWPRQARAVALNQLTILQRSTAAELRGAVRAVASAWGNPLDPDDVKDLAFLVALIAGFPEIHHGRLPRLVQKAVLWHRAEAVRQVQACLTAMGLPPETEPSSVPLAVPPVGVPDIEGISLLTTLADVGEEAARMRHCVLSRAAAAVAGRAFPFHVEREGQRATVELTPEGLVTEAAGPLNRHNAAVEWAAEALPLWWSAALEAQVTTGNSSRSVSVSRPQ